MTLRDAENRFLGCLIGMAIGDALGMPVADGPLGEDVRGYQPRHAGENGEIPAGEITDETEIVLCVVESMTTNDGHLDVENINARLMRLAEGASQHWMPAATREGILAAEANDGVVPDGFARPASLAASVLGIPIGLAHGVGHFDRIAFDREIATVTRLTNTSEVQRRLTARLAEMVIARLHPDRTPVTEADGDLGATLDAIAGVVDAAERFEDGVFAAVNGYRPADSAGAIGGALAGARFGASGIPQALIDDLSARVYLTLAAPWFFRTVNRRAGLVIDLRQT